MDGIKIHSIALARSSECVEKIMIDGTVAHEMYPPKTHTTRRGSFMKGPPKIKPAMAIIPVPTMRCTGPVMAPACPGLKW